MEAVDFSNSFNITLRIQLASHGRRIGAYLLDWCFMTAYGVFAWVLLYNTVLSWSVPEAQQVTIVVIAMLPLVFYHLWMEALFAGQTLGKMLLHIKVTKEDGSPVTFGACIMRWVFLLVDFWISVGYFGLIGLIVMSSSKKLQRTGDRAAGTIVVNTEIKSNIAYYDRFYRFDDGYQPLYPQAVALSDAQVSFITSLMIAAVGKKSYDKDIMAIALKVRGIMQLDPAVTKGASPRAFLQQVVKDYNYRALNVA